MRDARRLTLIEELEFFGAAASSFEETKTVPQEQSTQVDVNLIGKTEIERLLDHIRPPYNRDVSRAGGSFS